MPSDEPYWHAANLVAPTNLHVQAETRSEPQCLRVHDGKESQRHMNKTESRMAAAAENKGIALAFVACKHVWPQAFPDATDESR
jgi:hypothetical protein